MFSILSLWRDKRGVSSLEYAVLAGIVIAGLTVTLGTSAGSTGFVGNLKTMFTHIGSEMTGTGVTGG